MSYFFGMLCGFAVGTIFGLALAANLALRLHKKRERKFESFRLSQKLHGHDLDRVHDDPLGLGMRSKQKTLRSHRGWTRP